MEQIKAFYQGKFSKKTLTHRILPIAIPIFAFFLAIARLLFPYYPDYPYHWTTSMVSRLSIPHINVNGWYFFACAFITLGIFYFALVPYMYKRFSKLHGFAAKLMKLCMLGTSFGAILVAVVPNAEPKIFGVSHGLSAMLMSFGILGTALFSSILMTKDHLNKGKENSNFSGKIITLYIAIFVYICVCAYLMGRGIPSTDDRYYFIDPNTPPLISRPFWEWQLLVASIFLISLLCIVVPEEITALGGVRC